MLRYILGRKTSRKIVVFESDDWGSFRFKNETIRNKYLNTFEKSGWMYYYDCFESYEDLTALSNVLSKHKDFKSNSACFTFLFNPANPDFKKIEASGFEEYFYEDFEQILDKRSDGDKILKWYKQALNTKLLEIGFHGREHLNVNSWMNDLKNKDQQTIQGFKDNIWSKNIFKQKRSIRPQRSTYHIVDYDELDGLRINIKEGVALINKIFDQKTTYFLPPDGPYHLKLNHSLINNGIKFIGLAKQHNNPLETEWYKKKLFWLGKKTAEGLTVITRNVIFEPSSMPTKDWVGSTLNSIERAFKFKNPAVISTHRPNYIGTFSPANRQKSLSQLDQLLKTMLIKWPEVEFMTSSQLGQCIIKNQL